MLLLNNAKTTSFFLSQSYYHIITKGNNRNIIFKEKEDYLYSSYNHYANGKEDNLLTDDFFYQGLKKTKKKTIRLPTIINRQMKKKTIIAILVGIITIAGLVGSPSMQVTQASSAVGDSDNGLIDDEWYLDLNTVYGWGWLGVTPAIVNLPGVNSHGTDLASDLEIVTGSDGYGSHVNPTISVPGLWRAIDSLGNIEWYTNTFSDESRGSVVITDLDGDGNLEIIGGTTSGKAVEAMDRFGNYIWTFPDGPKKGIYMPGAFEFPSAPAAADLDSNISGLEVVVVHRPTGAVIVLDGDNSDGVNDGITFTGIGWYIWFGTEGIDWDVLWTYTMGGYDNHGSAAIGDVDNDGALEVVVGSQGGNVYVFDGATGALEATFSADAVEASSALANLDGDPYLEIVIGDLAGALYVFEWNGATASTQSSVSLGSAIYSSAAIGNIDSDSGLEIVVGTYGGQVYALTSGLSQEWVYPSTGSAGTFYASPSLADRVSVSAYDIEWQMFRHDAMRTGYYGSTANPLDIYIGSMDGYLYLLNGDDGTMIDRFQASGPIHGSPTIGDIDGDGRLNIIFQSWGEWSGGYTTYDRLWDVEEAMKNVAVILAEPNDVPHESSSITAQPCKLLAEKNYSNGHGKEYYQDLLYCVADYYKENSFGKVNLNFEIYDNNGEWFKTDKSEEEYLGKENEFVVDVINLAENEGINLAGQDMMIVAHPGTSLQKEKQKLSTQTWTPGNQPLGYPPYKIIIAEDDPIGAWAHEIGHIFGALFTPENTIIPDLSNEKLLMGFVEKWDLMARGSWNGGSLNINGTNPPYMSSYIKEFLQWLNYNIYPKSAYGEYWINSLETSGFGDSIFRYNLSDDTNDESPKYYILETRNRNLKTWDSSLPGLPVVGDKNLVLYYVDTKGLAEYGYVPTGIEEYQEGIMWNQYRTVTIPGNNPKNSEINDGILNPLINETYRDMDNLVKFSAITDRSLDDKYEIQAKIEEITYDSFSDNFWGVILKPKSTLKKWMEGVFNPNFADNSEPYKLEENSLEAQLAVAYFNPETGKWEGGAPMKPSSLKELIYKIKGFFFYVLIFFIILTILSALLCSVARWLSERKRKTIKNISRIIWITTLIIFIIFITCWVITTFLQEGAEAANNFKIVSSDNPKTIANPILQLNTSPDLDLHLYCDDGKHIGMNYGAGEYEVQTEGAIVSGDNQNAPEWIFVPENVINCHYVVSSYDNQRFLEENPGIAQEIPNPIDSYEVYARYIDPENDIYTSLFISQDIEPGVQLEHSITGTDDIIINSGEVTVDSIIGEIYQYFNLGWIDGVGVKEGLLSQLNNAKRKIELNQEQVAINILNAFINEVEAQKDKHIEFNATEILIRNTKEVINHL